jgi:RNA polymerase sigma-70 factor (ECF subfamily)
MASVRDGDVQKLGLLFDRYSRGLYNYFYLQVKDRLKSEDLVQNVFYNILRYRKTYKEGSEFRTWIYTIARNEKIHYFKKRRVSHNDIDIEQSNEIYSNPEKNLERKTNINHLNMALQRISSDNRELIILSRFNGLPYSQISKIMGCKIGTLKVRMYRAIKDVDRFYQNIAGLHYIMVAGNYIKEIADIMSTENVNVIGPLDSDVS